MVADGGGTGPNDGDLSFVVPDTGNLGSGPRSEKFRVRRAGALVIGDLEVTGDVIALTSDIRLKKDIEPITDALDKVTKIRGFTYKHNELARSECKIDTGDQRFAGVSAQEILEVLPEAVKESPSNHLELYKTTVDEDKYLTVQYEKLVPLLIEAIKELKNEIDELKKSN